MFTRSDYMSDVCTYDQYYSQFVTDAVRERVSSSIGLDRILKSTCEHMNDIGLNSWDRIGITSHTGDKVRAAGDNVTLATALCINKAAARQILTLHKK